ncbi:MAG: DUF1800 domain-containing protein [Haliea sp.]|uniref:DUF1800 domain-containing protein n=1 Tax=Haliea sp. TaxID=1932666 RepID=UPI0032EC4F8F
MARRLLASLLLAGTFAVVAGCGGGGGSETAQSPAPPDTPAPGGGDPAPVDPDTPEPLRGINAAARLASRATFGMPWAEINTIADRGQDAWLEDQFALPPAYHDPVVAELQTRAARGDFDVLDLDLDPVILQGVFSRMAWWHRTLTAEDQLRQRVAFALSEIFVVSDNLDVLFISPYAMSNYYDTLLSHAFGNFRDLLLAVTLHPTMGVYLSHINNARADPEANTFPDENYAREVMQLFSIGLFELNPDGSERLDDAGQPIPTYDNEDIGELARVFTGLSFAGANNRFPSRLPEFREPMRMFEAFHDNGDKQLLGGAILAGGQGGLQDIEDAIDNLFQHPNVGPFIGRQLIQRLVSSNPSPAYVERVTAAFNGDGGAVRGDMRSVLRAVLLDPEALALPDPDTPRGKLREPLLRLVAALRQLNASSPDGFYANTGFYVQEQIQQHPLSAPSVFNFFLPAFQPVGAIADAGLVAPEFQITNSGSVIAIANLLQGAVLGDFLNDLRVPPFSPASLDLDEYLALADDVPALLDRLDTVFTYGTLGDDSRDSIAEAAALIDDTELRVRVVLYLLLISPDYAVEL